MTVKACKSPRRLTPTICTVFSVLFAGSLSVVPAPVMDLAAINAAAAVQVPDRVFRQFESFGPVSAVTGRTATAQRAQKTLRFEVPSDVGDNVVPGQPIWATKDGRVVRFVKFPIALANTRTRVGRGTGNGSFWVETRGVQLHNTGVIVGRTKVLSEDVLQGFTGAAWINVLDEQGGPVAGKLAMCIGVNMRSGDEKAWELRIPREDASRARTVEVWHFKSSCGRDRWEALMKDAAAAGRAIGEWKEVIAAVAAGGA